MNTHNPIYCINDNWGNGLDLRNTRQNIPDHHFIRPMFSMLSDSLHCDNNDIMYYANKRDLQCDLQAEMYPNICKYHRMHINNGNDSPANISWHHKTGHLLPRPPKLINKTSSTFTQIQLNTHISSCKFCLHFNFQSKCCIVWSLLFTIYQKYVPINGLIARTGLKARLGVIARGRVIALQWMCTSWPHKWRKNLF